MNREGRADPAGLAEAVHLCRHPLAQHKLTLLRDRRTEPVQFRCLLRDLTQLLFWEATQDLRLEAVCVQTPLVECTGQRLGERIGLMPILRAGLGMVEPILDLIPDAEVWHLGLYRDRETLRPVTYYNNLPADLPLDLCLVLDPMLATGGSAVAAIELLKQGRARRIKFLGVLAAPEGVEAMRQAHPEVPLHLAAVDSHLDARKYIVPGLGDAGDRQFATPH